MMNYKNMALSALEPITHDIGSRPGIAMPSHDPAIVGLYNVSAVDPKDPRSVSEFC